MEGVHSPFDLIAGVFLMIWSLGYIIGGPILFVILLWHIFGPEPDFAVRNWFGEEEEDNAKM